MTTSIYLGVSLDGFIAKPDGNLDWLVKFQNEEIGESYEEFMSTVDAVVIGKGTFEAVLAYPSWPYDKPVFVLSESLNHVPDHLRGNVGLLSLKPSKVLERLSSLGYNRVYVDGGKTIQGFLSEDCIDEIVITRVPVLIGTGRPLFGPLEQDLSLRHLDTRVFSNGLVQSRYERSRS